MSYCVHSHIIHMNSKKDNRDMPKTDNDWENSYTWHNEESTPSVKILYL